MTMSAVVAPSVKLGLSPASIVVLESSKLCLGEGSPSDIAMVPETAFVRHRDDCEHGPVARQHCLGSTTVGEARWKGSTAEIRTCGSTSCGSVRSHCGP